MKAVEKIAAVGCTVALAATLAGCSSGSAEQTTASEEPAQQQSTSKDFDGSALSDTGAGTMMLRTAGGTTEGGNVPEVATSGKSMMQIEIDTDGMDGSVCTVYVDGMENTTMNAGERTQNTLTLQGDALKAGTHTVEIASADGSIYKKAGYKAA